MDRRDRDRYDQNDYGRYDDYRNDTHYHSAQNLTDRFEQDFQRHQGHRGYDRNRPGHTYHEGDMGGAYEQRRSGNRGYGGNQRNDWDRGSYTSSNFDRGNDRYSNYSNDNRRGQDRYRSDWGSRQDRGDMSQRYGTADRYDHYNPRDSRWSGGERSYNAGSGDNYRSSNYSDRNYGRDRDRENEDHWRDRHRLNFWGT